MKSRALSAPGSPARPLLTRGFLSHHATNAARSARHPRARDFSIRLSPREEKRATCSKTVSVSEGKEQNFVVTIAVKLLVNLKFILNSFNSMETLSFEIQFPNIYEL